jgi:hypothetical protein
MKLQTAFQICLTLAEDGYEFWKENGAPHPDMIEAISQTKEYLEACAGTALPEEIRTEGEDDAK